MAQDFSDPLTSAAYASSKTTAASGSDPLLAPTPTKGPLSGQASSPTKTRDSLLHSYSINPLSSSSPSPCPSPSPAQHQNSRLAQSASTQPKPASPLPKRATTTAKPNRFSQEVSSFSSPSSPLSHPFADPLDSGHSNGGDYEPYMKTTSGHSSYQQYNNNNTNINNQAGNRSTIASFPTTSVYTASLPNSSRQSPAPTQPPPVTSSSPSSTTPPPALRSSSPKAVSPPKITRRDSSYDQQRVKAPQYLHITIPDTDRRGKDGMFILSVQV